MKVLHVISSTDRRGAQVFALELVERLEELGLTSEVVALQRGAVGGVDVPTLARRAFDPRGPMALHRRMRNVDVTVAHGSRTLVACSVAGIGAGPFVYRQISDPVFWTPTLVRRLRVRAYYRFPRHVVALSPTTETLLRSRFGVRDITVIPNGVDERRCQWAGPEERLAARRRLSLAPGGSVVGFVGALVEEKGAADLLAAVPGDATVLIAGDGPQRAALEATAAARGDRVRFLGQLEDPRDVYAASDVVVLPSRGGDTQPATLIEAALIGTPSIATPVGAISDIVQPTNGILVPIGDPEALSTAITGVLSDPELRDRLGRAASEDARRRFSLEVVARQWAEVLRAAAR
jgi:glycosyltransferase involved in cell wall biosynthesis